jgi:uncharacterized repeat protein (TIGR03803 family)
MPPPRRPSGLARPAGSGSPYDRDIRHRGVVRHFSASCGAARRTYVQCGERVMRIGILHLLLLSGFAITACSQAVTTTPLPAESQMRISRSGTNGSLLSPSVSDSMRVVYRFNATGVNGANPAAPLTELNGLLYGTTQSGGGSGSHLGAGTVYALDPSSGREHAIYTFKGGSDGAGPVAPVIAMNGVLYGTTGDTVFALDPSSRVERVLRRFSKGSGIVAGLLDLKGTLYGTTSYGGTGCLKQGCGTVFAVDAASGQELVVHRFTAVEGSGPAAALVKVGAMLYGTTAYGGSLSCAPPRGCGSVYVLDPSSGQIQIIHRFAGGSDGANPAASLTLWRGRLYGTTSAGGGTIDCNGDPEASCGTVFVVDPRYGIEHIVYSFKGASDGSDPMSALLVWRGELYGTTYLGGGSSCTRGCGTIFAVDPASGKETVLRRLTVNAAYPVASLTPILGTLYGTTYSGGSSTCVDNDGGCGTVFATKP